MHEKQLLPDLKFNLHFIDYFHPNTATMKLDLNKVVYRHITECSQEIISLISNTTYGTDGLRLQHKDTEKKILELHEPHFHTLWQDSTLLAVAVQCNREVWHHKTVSNAYYYRYFSVKEEFQNMGLGKMVAAQIESYYTEHEKRKSVYYANIEKKNFRSMGVSNSVNNQTLGIMKTIFFSRFFPKKDQRCRAISSSEVPKIKSLLKEFYSDHTTVWLHRIGYENAYYVLEENGEIVAGVQAINTTWKLKNLPGLMGWLTINVFPYTPIISRLANGKNFNYLAFEGIYCQPGRTDALLKLMEHALNAQRSYKGFIYLDTKDPLYPILNNHPLLGTMHKMQKSHDVIIFGRFMHYNEDEIQSFIEHPKYISAYDVT